MDDSATYRTVIDEMVRACREGQGQIGPQRARKGIWNAAAHKSDDDFLADQRAMNALLTRLDEEDRELLAAMLEQAFIGGVHESLVILNEAGIAPFDQAYEGTPFHDFVGRLDGWQWPATRQRTP